MREETRTGWAALIADTTRRHGAFHLRRCADYGLVADTVRRRARRESWERPYPAVFCLPGSVEGWWRTASARLEAVGADAALGLRSAAYAHGMLGRSPSLTEIARGHNRSRSTLRLVAVRTSRTLAESDVAVVNGLRSTTPSRTLRDLAGPLEVDPLRAIALDGFTARAFELAALHAEIARMPAGPARRRLEQVAKDLARVRTESLFAYEVLEALAATGLPIECEFPWRCPDGRIIHHDGAIPTAWVAVECDGRGKYETGSSFTTDRKRWTQTSGRWRTVWVDWTRWRREPAAVIGDVWRAVAESDPAAAPAERADCRCRRCRGWARSQARVGEG